MWREERVVFRIKQAGSFEHSLCPAAKPMETQTPASIWYSVWLKPFLLLEPDYYNYPLMLSLRALRSAWVGALWGSQPHGAGVCLITAFAGRQPRPLRRFTHCWGWCPWATTLKFHWLVVLWVYSFSWAWRRIGISSTLGRPSHSTFKFHCLPSSGCFQ